jgi:[acyl-carrier-protein] S-malonyltransferase
MDFPTALKLVARRGELMQQAATAVPSGMVSIVGLDEAKAQELCRAASEGQVLTCANFNCPGQIVLSGEIDACRRVEAKAKEFGASAAVPLKVAGAFHSKIMAPAAEKLAEALDRSALRDPRLQVVSNVDAQAYRGAGEIKGKLLAQLVSPVRWQQGVEFLLKAGVGTFYEIGPGRVLAGLMRRIDRKARIVSVNSREAIEKLADSDK